MVYVESAVNWSSQKWILRRDPPVLGQMMDLESHWFSFLPICWLWNHEGLCWSEIWIHLEPVSGDRWRWIANQYPVTVSSEHQERLASFQIEQLSTVYWIHWRSISATEIGRIVINAYRRSKNFSEDKDAIGWDLCNMRLLRCFTITSYDEHPPKVAGSNPPTVHQLPRLVALCWPRPLFLKMVCTAISLVVT